MNEPHGPRNSFLKVAGTGTCLTLIAWGMVFATNSPNVLLPVGLAITIGIAGVWASYVRKRALDLDSLADRIGNLAELEREQDDELPLERAAHWDGIYRCIGESRTKLKSRFKKLELERRRGFQVLGHMTDGVIAVSGERRVILLNTAAIRLLGLTRPGINSSAVDGRGLPQTNLPERRIAEIIRIPQVIGAVDRVLAGNGPEDLEFDLPAEHDRHLRLQAIGLPAEGADGVLVTIRDETQVRKLEMLRREFIANVSHELKTPLAAVKGYTETLLLGAKDDAEVCTHFLQQIDFQASRLERLINDMLQLARAQTGTENLVLTTVSLSSVIRESLTTYEPMAQARGTTLVPAAVPQHAHVFADREALVTIVNNLLGNAIRYTPDGGRVELSCYLEGKFWVIAVVDNGIGIPLEDQCRIFERFYRVEKARDASRGGTGLGLSIVKNLVQALQGDVRLASQPGKGSKFEVLIPLTRG
jgi:two-component system phosphate regulon sensor histidine kinase PhoR